MARGGALTVADMFCGAGGLSEGFRAAGFTVVAGTDWDPDACATFRLNFPEAQTVCGAVQAPEAREAFLAAASEVTVLVGGPPCQGFSQVRNYSRLIDDPRNRLYREFVSSLGALLPRAFLMENVPGLAEMGLAREIARDLSLDGEYVVAAGVHDAADFGVPQTRRRLIFAGARASSGQPLTLPDGAGAARFLRLRRTGEGPAAYKPAADPGARPLLQRLADAADPGLVTAAQAIGDLKRLARGPRRDAIPAGDLPPPVSAYQLAMREGCGAVLANTAIPRINADTALRLQSIPPGGNHCDLPEALLARYLTGQRWGPENGSGRLGRRHYYAYRRLHPAMWSWTLNTKADSVYHWLELRALSVREFARLQSFPDRFAFTTDPRPGELPGRIAGGPGHSRYRQAGNAVPPLLARAFAEAIAASLASRQRLSA